MKKIVQKFILIMFFILIVFFIIRTPQFKKILFEIELAFTKPSESLKINFDKSSFQYVNDLYFSNSLYYNSLSVTEQEVYKLFLENIKNYNNNFSISQNTFSSKEIAKSSLEKITHSITADHPELIQFSHSSITLPGNLEEPYTIIIHYTYQEKNYTEKDYEKQILYIKNCLNEIKLAVERKK